MFTKSILAAGLMASVNAEWECPSGFDEFNNDGMCVLSGFLSTEYICPGYVHGESHEHLTTNGSFILCPGKGCGNEHENWCCPSSES